VTNYFSGKRDVYIEIAQRYIEFIRLGVLKEGDRLPSVRVAAGDLGVNPNTVQRAYAYLEELGMIRLLPKKGAYVTGNIRQETAQNTEALNAIAALKKSGIDKAAVLLAVEEVYCND
jgi:GntR family transcriptional regulator